MAWINKVGPWVKVYTAKCSTQSSRALNGLICILGGVNWICLTECRSKLLSALKGRLQTGYSLSKNIAVGRESST